MKILAQIMLPPLKLTNIFEATTYRIVTGFIICNRSNVQVAFRMSFAPEGAVDHVSQYIFYDTPILPNDSLISGLEVGVAPKDIIRAYANSGDISITLLGSEWS